MVMRLYDLAGASDDHRFSPNCWRVRMALAHKSLEVQTLPWRFTEKDEIAFSGQGTVPVLVDGDTNVHDSWDIAGYLDRTYPQKPLFDSEQSRAEGLFIKLWVETQINPIIARIILVDLHGMLHDKDKEYFKESREKRFGMALDSLCADRPGQIAALVTALTPLRQMLKVQPYIGGKSANYADYIAFAALQWARTSAPVEVLESDDPVHAWRERLLDMYDGLARNTPLPKAA